MADSKITALAALTAADPANDMVPIVDVSDNSMAASGTTKRISINNILACSPSATLASATITGDLTVDTSTLKVDSTNNRVGIGTASPAAPLHIQAPGTDSAAIRLAAAGGRTYDINSTAAGYGSANNLIIYDITGSAERWRLDATGIHTWNNVGGVAGTAMTLNSTGLGVGTASPAFKLDVSGSAGSGIRFTGNSVSTVMGETGGFGLLGTTTNHNLGLYTNGSVKATIDTSGNVGIGVTPSATDSTYYQALEITRVGQGLTGAKNALTSSPNSWFSNNSYATYSAGIVWKYAVSQPAAQYRLLDASHLWYSASSGTLNTAIAFGDPKMTLDGSGNLLVGTASGSFRGQFAVASGADRNIFTAQVTGASNGFQILWNHATTTTRVIIANIPTSSAGLAAGTLWNDAGTIKIA